jgi:hypothetical protein
MRVKYALADVGLRLFIDYRARLVVVLIDGTAFITSSSAALFAMCA